MIRKILIGILLLLLLFTTDSVGRANFNIYNADGWGTWVMSDFRVCRYPLDDTEYGYNAIIYNNAACCPTYYQYVISHNSGHFMIVTYDGGVLKTYYEHTSGVYTYRAYTTNSNVNSGGYAPLADGLCGNGKVMLTLSQHPFNSYTISGNLCGITSTQLYIKDINDIYHLIETNTSTEFYSFDILNNSDYKLVFSDTHEYEFTATGNITYNYSTCFYITLNFKDNCGNLIQKTAGTYYKAGDPLSQNFYTSSGIYEFLYEDENYIELWVDSAIGTLYYNISNPSTDIGYTILNPTISWNNNIMVVNGSTLNPISGALVSFFQDCIIDPSVYPSRNKFTNSSGIVNFEQCELNSFSLGVSADGYKSYSGSMSSSAMNAFILSQTVMIKLYPADDEENESEYIYTDYNTWVKFKNVDGNYTSIILDTDEYVDLYYYNNNSDGEAMTLKFQKYSIETGIIDLLSWNIPIETDGYKRILKSNYTDTSYLYIGYLYNYGIDGWDRTKYLNVLNNTTEIDLHYENLTAFLWFKNKNPEGSIDYREDIEIIAYANTTYVGLFNISLELYDNSSFIMHINLTWADFTGADIEYYYEWNPLHSYINGHNYTVRMHGYDYYLLDMDYVNATDYRKNKLTIIVKDRSGANLDNSFVFLEGYGSLLTGDSYYNSYEKLVNGNYRYKASKSGYSGTGWDEITLADGDEIVTYILISDTANTTYLPQKTTDKDIQAIFFPLMFTLLIFILIGAFKYVCE